MSLPLRILRGALPLIGWCWSRTRPVQAFSSQHVPTPITKSSPVSVYVNLPFCRRRCFYCDFPIKVVGDGPGAAAAAAKPYVDTVVQEIRATAANWKITTRTPVSDGRYNHGAEKDPTHSTIMTPSPDTPSPPTTRKATTVPGYAFPSRVPSAAFRGDGEVVEEEDVPCGSGGGCGGVKTLFFGGGTPSLCPPELVKVLIDTVQECFGISADAEISMEMDPGTFDEERLLQFLSLGVNRVSMGVQSFDADLLRSCGRAHSLQDVYDAVQVMRKAGVENFSIDLMSGLPNQTIDQWEYTLAEAVSTGAAHISVYDLQVEAGTAFGRWYTAGAAPLPREELCADMYRAASRVLRSAGYEHYEISNYAKPGFQSRHNRAYWENVPFWAFGNGAASYIDGHRFSRPRDLPVYTRWVDRLTKEGWGRATSEEATTDGVEGGKIVASSEEPLVAGAAEEKQDRLLDDVMLGFRLSEGIDLDELAVKYGSSAAEKVETGAAEGLRCGWVELAIEPAAAAATAAEVVGAVHMKPRGSHAVSSNNNIIRTLRSSRGSGGRGEMESVEGLSSSGVGSGASRDGDEGVGEEIQRSGLPRGTTEVGGGETGSEVEGGAGSRITGRRKLRLSDPDGFLFSNSVISSVFCELDKLKASQQ